MLRQSTDLSRLLLESNLDLLRALGNAVAKRDSDTDAQLPRHLLSIALAETLHLGEATIPDLIAGALLHDVGKIGIPDSILLKPGPLPARRVWRHEEPRPPGCRDRGQPLARGRRADHPASPRALRRNRLSRRPARHRNTARRAHIRRRGRIRRPHLEAPLQGANGVLRGLVRYRAPIRKALRSRGRDRLRHDRTLCACHGDGHRSGRHAGNWRWRCVATSRRKRPPERAVCASAPACPLNWRPGDH